MKRHNLFNLIFFTILSVLLFLQITVLTSNAAERDSIINAELDCVSDYMDDNSMQWQDVCYTPNKRSVSLEMDTNGKVTYGDGRSAAKKGVQPIFPDSDDYGADDEEEYVQFVDASDREEVQYLGGEDYGLYNGVDEEDSYPNDDSFFWKFFDRNNPKNEITYGSQIFFFTYREPSVMRIRGIMYGGNMEYIYRFSENEKITSFKEAFSDVSKINLIKFEGMGAFGKGDYESEGTGNHDDRDGWMYEVRGMAGYEIPVHDALEIMPYAGFGFRRLYDDGRGRSTTNAVGYRRYSRYIYMPFGIETESKLKGGWSFGTNLEYDLFLDGEQESYLGDAGGVLPAFLGYPVVENDQNSGDGWRGSITITKETKDMDLFIKPFVNYWSIKDSEISTVTHLGSTTSWIEPENNTTEYGVKVGARF